MTGIESDMELFFLLKWLQFVLLVVLQPILCFASIAGNLLVICTIRNKTKHKEFHDKMYNFMLVNAAYNVLYAIVGLLKLMNTCVFFHTPIMCSSVYQTHPIQYFKIVGVFFMGNVFKLGANISYVSFTLSRLITVSDIGGKSLLATKLKRVSTRVYAMLFFVFSSGLSSFILFQYRINRNRDYRKEFPYESRVGNFCHTLPTQCKLFNAFKIATQVLDGVGFFLLNVIIDVLLLKKYSSKLRSKAHLIGIQNADSVEEFKKKKHKLTKMVVFNSFFYFCAHVPKLCTTTLLIVFAEKLTYFCKETLSCDLINEEAEFFVLFSMAGNFFICYYFNRNFRQSVRELANRWTYIVEKECCFFVNLSKMTQKI